MEATLGVRAGRRHDRRVGRRAARGVRRIPGADRAVRRGQRRLRRGSGPVARDGSGDRGRAGHAAAAHAGRQARAGRALQRRRADRGARARRRLRGRLPGHPADARRRSWRPRSRRTSTSSACRCCPDRTCARSRRCWTGCERPASSVPVVVGGIIPPDDAETLREAGVARVFTPKDFALTEIIDELVTVVREANGLD